MPRPFAGSPPPCAQQGGVWDRGQSVWQPPGDCDSLKSPCRSPLLSILLGFAWLCAGRPLVPALPAGAMPQEDFTEQPWGLWDPVGVRSPSSATARKAMPGWKAEAGKAHPGCLSPELFLFPGKCPHLGAPGACGVDSGVLAAPGWASQVGPHHEGALHRAWVGATMPQIVLSWWPWPDRRINSCYEGGT